MGLAGFWIGTKLWCGKYLELDNVVVHADFRSKGIGSIMTKYLNQKAIDEDCNMIALDAYTTNFGAQKFYMNHGFVPKGFHFVKYLKYRL
jgi:ribosomal protein S18 acetylase RimI-like enzyme